MPAHMAGALTWDKDRKWRRYAVTGNPEKVGYWHNEDVRTYIGAMSFPLNYLCDLVI